MASGETYGDNSMALDSMSNSFDFLADALVNVASVSKSSVGSPNLTDFRRKRALRKAGECIDSSSFVAGGGESRFSISFDIICFLCCLFFVWYRTKVLLRGLTVTSKIETSPFTKIEELAEPQRMQTSGPNTNPKPLFKFLNTNYSLFTADNHR